VVVAALSLATSASLCLFCAFGRRESWVAADASLHLVAGNVGPLDYDFVPNHDCRGHGQLQLEVLVRVVFSLGLGGELETWSP